MVSLLCNATVHYAPDYGWEITSYQNDYFGLDSEAGSGQVSVDTPANDGGRCSRLHPALCLFTRTDEQLSDTARLGCALLMKVWRGLIETVAETLRDVDDEG